MKYSEARDKLNEVATGAIPNGWPIQYQDIPSDEINGEAPSAAPWARVTIRHADRYQSSLTGPSEGKKRYTAEGTLHIQLFSPSGDGLTAVSEAADVVAEWLEEFKHVSLWFRDIRVDDNATLDRAGMNQVKVLATFQYDTVR